MDSSVTSEKHVHFKNPSSTNPNHRKECGFLSPLERSRIIKHMGFSTYLEYFWFIHNVKHTNPKVKVNLMNDECVTVKLHKCSSRLKVHERLLIDHGTHLP